MFQIPKLAAFFFLYLDLQYLEYVLSDIGFMIYT